jgi:hypothetical protein
VFITHQTRATTQAQDALFHQQQATLRNDNSDLGTIWILSRLAYTWRSRSPKTFRKSMLIILMGSLHLIDFSAASVLASRITTTNEEVLIARNTFCGPWTTREGHDLTELQQSLLEEDYETSTMQSVNEYVQSCLTEPQSTRMHYIQASTFDQDLNNKGMLVRGTVSWSASLFGLGID